MHKGLIFRLSDTMYTFSGFGDSNDNFESETGTNHGADVSARRVPQDRCANTCSLITLTPFIHIVLIFGGCSYHQHMQTFQFCQCFAFSPRTGHFHSVNQYVIQHIYVEIKCKSMQFMLLFSSNTFRVHSKNLKIIIRGLGIKLLQLFFQARLIDHEETWKSTNGSG